MSLDNDFELQPTAATAPPSVRPIVVVHQPSRMGMGLRIFGPPAMLILTALAIVSWKPGPPIIIKSPSSAQPEPSEKPLVVETVATSPLPPHSAPPATSTEPAILPATAVPILADRSAWGLPLPVPEPVPPGQPAAPPRPQPPPEVDRPRQVVTVIPPRVPTPVPKQAEPSDEPLPTAREALAEIADEAAQRKAEAARLNRVKPELLAQDREDAKQQRVHDEQLTAQATERERKPFHRDLAALLARAVSGPGLTQQIQRLCVRYQHTVADRATQNIDRFFNGPATRMNRDERVRTLRRLGLPEPSILNYLRLLDGSRMLQRGGPRDEHDAWFRAARQLLEVKP